MRFVSLFVLLAALTAIAAHAQTTMIIVPSNTDDPVVDAASEISDGIYTKPSFWIATDPVGLVMGRPGYDIPPYARLLFYFPGGSNARYGLGVDVELNGGAVGGVGSVQMILWTIQNRHEVLMGGRFGIRPVNREDMMIDLLISAGWQGFFGRHLVVNAMVGIEPSQVSRTYHPSHGVSTTPQRRYPDGVDFGLQIETGYTF